VLDRRAAALVVALVLVPSGSLLADWDGAIRNWPAPPYWMLQKADFQKDPADGEDPGVQPAAVDAVPTVPLAFTGIMPCRIADTRGNGFTGAYGPPALSAGASRNFVLIGQCGISAAAQAVSLNITVTNTQGPGFILIYPEGGAQPAVSTLNYVAGQTIANAAVVPLGTGGGVTVIAGVSGTNLIIDTNGYYSPEGGPGGLLPVGSANQTLRHNGTSWVPNFGLTSTGTGASVNGVLNLSSSVTRLGQRFLTSAAGNLTLGDLSGGAAMTGDANTAVGDGALFSDTSGAANTAIGFQALNNNSTANYNTAVGYHALITASAGDNTAVGYQALAANTGGGNIALGSGAGVNLTSGGFNMYLGNEGVGSESATIRIGSGLQHSRLFVAGVFNSGVSGLPVLISGTGQLGIAVSSARYKENIRDMGDASDRLLELRPVTFRYKGHPDDPTQFGLVAEEVEKVLPELVFHDADGRPESVMYQELPAMLLNEIQKQKRRIEAQESEIQDLRAAVEALRETQARRRAAQD
jgi:Chaperone of endosialidase